MKRYLIFAMFVVLAVALISPFSVSAKTKAGVKSGSFFYFFDKAFERADLFFTFSFEKKAKKVLENAEERLAEAEELEKEKEEKEETKEIETSEKEIEKTDNKLEEEESEETEIKDDKKDEQSKEIEKLKKGVEALKQKTSQIKIIEKIVEKPVVIEIKQSSSSQTNNQTKQNENIVTLPNGSMLEMDANGNVVRTIKEAPSASEIINTYIPKKIEIITDTEVKKSSQWTPSPYYNLPDHTPPSYSEEQQKLCEKWGNKPGSHAYTCLKWK